MRLAWFRGALTGAHCLGARLSRAVPRARRPEKPRHTGLTEIRGPYYATFGTRHLADVLEVAGQWVDGIKYARGSFALMPKAAVEALTSSPL